MASDDLFVWLDAIWNKKKPEGTFPAFIAHRFLASDRQWAYVAKVIGEEVRDPAMAFAVWQAITPFADGAPRLIYPAAKKRADAEALTARMMVVLHVRRNVAEDMQRVVEKAGRLSDLYKEFGVEQKEGEIEGFERGAKKPKKKEPAGLMAFVK